MTTDPREAPARTIVRRLRDGEQVRIPKPTVPQVLKVVAAYYQLKDVGLGGVLHIITEDGNVEQGHADWCLASALESGYSIDSDADVFVAWLVSLCSTTQRRKLYRKSIPYRYDSAFGEDNGEVEAFWAYANECLAAPSLPEGEAE